MAYPHIWVRAVFYNSVQLNTADAGAAGGRDVNETV